MRPNWPDCRYISLYYIIISLNKLNGKLTAEQKLQYCKNFQCDETVNEKVCGIRKENGINTYRIFDNECLLLKYGCQVNNTEAYGRISMNYCDELTSQGNDTVNCQTSCISDVEGPVCGIRQDGDGFSIKMFGNKCQLSKYNCERHVQFNVTDFFICNGQNKYQPIVHRSNSNEEIYSDLSRELNSREDDFNNNNEAGKSVKMNDTINVANETSNETNNIKTSSEETSAVEIKNLERHTMQTEIREIYDDIDATRTNNEGTEEPILTLESTTNASSENNKTIFKNIIVVRGSKFDMQNINRTAESFFAATHVFDLPIREMQPNLTERTRRMLIRIFGPTKVFTPWLEIPSTIKEDRNHKPTLSSCFHKCPTKCPDTYAPVCGVPGIVAREPSLMFQNHCFMDVAQCKMFWEDKSSTAESSAYIESSFLFCLGNELNGLYRFLPLVRTLQHMGRLKRKGKFKYKLKNMRFFNQLLDKQPNLMG